MHVCERCGRTVETGEWPFCPHGRSTLSVRADSVPGGFVVENGFDRPTRFDSHSAHEQALAAKGLEIRAKNAGPHDKICPRWDSVDLDAAAQLVQRGVQARREKQKDPPIPITVRDLGGTIRKGDL